MELSAGDRVDRFVLVSQLGEGGQGAVWKAEDPLSPGEPRALKLVAVNPARPNDVERVRREARALARLSHPSMVQCHGLFEDLKLGVVGVVMDFVDGASLRGAERDPRLGQGHRIAVLKHVARVLSYLHGAGVVHRDLKLDNVLVKSAFFDAPDDPGNVKVVDLGIAAVKDAPGKLTALGTVVGTMAYLAPELLDPATFTADESSPAIDVFAFGVLGWQLLTGEHPTGLPSSAQLVDYVRAYRQALTLPSWPPAPPPGEWGQLLLDALRVRQAERIGNGSDLSARAEIAPGGGVVVRPGAGPLSQPEFAPTSVASPGAMRDATVASAVPAATQGIGPARSVATSAAPTPPATALTSEPSARGGWLWGTVGVLAVGAVGGLIWMLFGPKDNVYRPTDGSAQVPLPSATGKTKALAPTSTATQESLDAATALLDAAAVALPEGCDEAGACDCCPSGRSCEPGLCTALIQPHEEFRLRLAEMPMNGDKPLATTHPTAEVCVKVSDVAEYSCMPVRELANAGSATSYATVTMVDLTEKGIDVLVRFVVAEDVKPPLGRTERVTFPGASRALVCKGVTIELKEEKHVSVSEVRFFLDDNREPAAPERTECP